MEPALLRFLEAFALFSVGAVRFPLLHYLSKRKRQLIHTNPMNRYRLKLCIGMRVLFFLLGVDTLLSCIFVLQEPTSSESMLVASIASTEQLLVGRQTRSTAPKFNAEVRGGLLQ